ncbi:hypothetical protein [Pseudoxanthomonas sp.]|uniref:hypothetical protein n=1 Tax=Pseudoxanthomonas sp. TaxID=1871049 RepID=UPI0026016A41|nr:hypothetical protein [Pseudoxanthomonas sp.]WDS36225.1 MAG: hypothetical protein O8I58_18470 [Pseudoxanthomonas sp.]
MPLESMDHDRLLMMARLTQMDADAHQQRYSHNARGHPGKKRAAQLQAEASVLRREIKRRKREGKGNG